MYTMDTYLVKKTKCLYRFLNFAFTDITAGNPQILFHVACNRFRIQFKDIIMIDNIFYVIIHDMKYTIIFFTILILAVVTFQLYTLQAPLEPSVTKVQPRLTTLQIGYLYLPGNHLINLANELGYFREEGINLKQHDITPSIARSLADFASGTIDISSASNSRFYERSELNHHGTFGLTVYDPLLSTVILATGTIIVPHDLKGKRVGVIPGNEFFIYWMLEKNNLKRSDIKLISEDYSALANDFKVGKFDAVLEVSPYWDKLVDEGAGHIIYRAAEALGVITTGLVFHDNLVNKNPALVSAFNRAYFKAYHYAKSHPEDAARRCSRWLGLKPEVVRKMLDSYYFFPDERENASILSAGIGIDHLISSINYMYLDSGNNKPISSETMSRISNKFIPSISE